MQAADRDTHLVALLGNTEAARDERGIDATDVDILDAFELRLDEPGATRVLTDTIKDTEGLDLDRFLTELAAALDVPWTRELEARYADGLIMGWDDVRAIAADMDVESHGRRHRVLQTLSDAELADDLAGSRRDLEAQLGRPVQVIAYPVGRRVHRDERIRAALAAAGYRAGLSNHSGVNWWPWRRGATIDRFDLRRIATDRAMSESMFAAQVAIPPLAYVSPHNR